MGSVADGVDGMVVYATVYAVSSVRIRCRLVTGRQGRWYAKGSVSSGSRLFHMIDSVLIRCTIGPTCGCFDLEGVVALEGGEWLEWRPKSEVGVSSVGCWAYVGANDTSLGMLRRRHVDGSGCLV